MSPHPSRSILVALVGESVPPHGANGGPPFLTATFSHPGEALAAAVLLSQGATALPHGPPPLRIGVAFGDPSEATTDATRLVEQAAVGEILLTASAADAVGSGLPDGMALQVYDGDRFRLVSAVAIVPHRLPSPSTSFIGRTAQMADVKDLLRRHRLVSLTGAPGSGKTRLAVEVTRAILGEFSDGAWFVPLAPIRDPKLVPAAVVAALGLKEDPSTTMPEVVARGLADQRLLLVLDNFEHLLDGAPTVSDWLTAAPQLHVLVTSREALHLPAEHEYPVPPLGVPGSADGPDARHSEAVQLFTVRAGTALPDFELNEGILDDVTRICTRLDGLPLAVELAAARAKSLPVSAIRARLEQSLGLLTHGARDMPSRHRSLRAAISWSHGMLSADEQRFLRRLAIFRGGWDLEAADAVCEASAELGADAAGLTGSLLDKSLIHVSREPLLHARYEMLETLHEYGREQLIEVGEAESTAHRHALWFLSIAESAEPSLTGRDQGALLDRLEREHDNFRAALRWAIDGRELEIGLRLAAALWRFWQIRGHISEGRDWLAQLLQLDVPVPPGVRAAGLSAAGSLAYWQDDQQSAVRMYEASLALRREEGDPSGVAAALYDLSIGLSMPGRLTQDLPRGLAMATEALEIYRSLGDRLGEARTVWAIGFNMHKAGDNENAVKQLLQSVELFRTLDDPFGLGWALDMLGDAALRVDRTQLAEESWREALEIFSAAHDMAGIDTLLDALGALAHVRGQTERGIRLTAAAARVRRSSGSMIAETVREAEHRSHTGGSRISEAAIDAARREGEAMTMEEAIAYALEPQDAAVSGAEAPGGLRIYALGPMRVERAGVPIRRWGGEKAGSRQAQAIFGFLFDRGDQGLVKDEVTELIWPDLPIHRGDLAFHRTLGGLRAVLELDRPGLKSVTHSGGRYRLNPAIVAWADVENFEERLVAAARSEGDEAIAALEEARRLYRGDLLDDCPVYGESSAVEERRTYLRGQFVDALVALAERYEQKGDLVAAAARYRQALSVRPEFKRAVAGLDRLGMELAT